MLALCKLAVTNVIPLVLTVTLVGSANMQTLCFNVVVA